MEILSPGAAAEEKSRLYSELPAPADWLKELCQPPFQPDRQAAAAWAILLPHLRPGRLPTAGALDLEKSWSRSFHRKSLQVGLELLVSACPSHIDGWFRLAPLRFLKTARMLGSLALERRKWAISQASQHPFFDPQGLHLPSENLGQACLTTWSPLPPPSRVVDAVGRQLSEHEESQLRLSIANWIPLAQLEILRHYCAAKVAKSLPTLSP